MVLVHGAWHGAWCWQRVTPLLMAEGFDVRTPTLTGLGDRAHLVSPTVGLATHVEDVVTFLRANDLDDVLLVGHSYAGFVVREAADRVPDRVGAVALIDAWVGEDATSLDSQAPAWFTDALRAAAQADGFGWLCPPPTPDLVGVADPDEAAWLQARLVPHPLRTFSDRTHLTGAVTAIPHHAAVCTQGLGLPFAELAERVGCRQPTPLESGHDAMVTAPEAVARFLADAAAA